MEESEELKIQPPVLESPWRIFFWEVFLFSLTQLLGIATALRVMEILKKEKISVPTISFSNFLLYFILANVFVLGFLFFTRRKEKNVILKGIFLFSIGISVLLFVNAWISDIISFVITLLLIFLFIKRPSLLIHNLVMVFGMAGAGSVLGLRMEPQIVVALLIVFSIYDFIAVYKTKHMVKMAKEMMKRGAIVALIIPPTPSDFKGELKQVKPGGKFLILGGGDVVFPLLFCCSLLSEGLLSSLIVALFSVLGLFVSFLIFIIQKERKPIPALPPIALFSIVGYLITKLLKHLVI